MNSEKREKNILRISFFAGLLFAVAEFIFAIWSHSKSSLTDAVYDASELVFVALMVFLTPLFYKPVSEKHPYGYYQIETIFLIIKNVMLLSVTFSVLASVIESALSGGNDVDRLQVSLFQFGLGIACILVYCTMYKMNKKNTSPMIRGELLGWKLDIGYSMGMSIAFFASLALENTPMAWIAPYFDPIMAVVVMICMVPECIQMLVKTIREVFLFPPDGEVVKDIKRICNEKLPQYKFYPVFFDITKTGRHLWIAIYFEIKGDFLCLGDLKKCNQELSLLIQKKFGESTCELIVV